MAAFFLQVIRNLVEFDLRHQALVEGLATKPAADLVGNLLRARRKIRAQPVCQLFSVRVAVVRGNRRPSISVELALPDPLSLRVHDGEIELRDRLSELSETTVVLERLVVVAFAVGELGREKIGVRRPRKGESQGQQNPRTGRPYPAFLVHDGAHPERATSRACLG